jgi:uroporphyrinogen-III synthase
MTDPVVLTRAPGRNDGLAAALRAAGVPTIEWPALAIVPLRPERLAERLRAPVLAFESPSAAEAVADELPEEAVLVAQGPGTAAALGRSSVVADPPTAEGLVAAVAAVAAPGAHVALVRGDKARDVALDGLRALGFEVDPLVVYANRAPADVAHPARPLSAVVYPSPSAVDRLLGANPWLRDVPAVAIGPTTAAALAGVARVVVAEAPTDEALRDAVLSLLVLETP